MLSKLRCRVGLLGPVFDSFEKPFPRAEPWLDYWRVVGDASPGLVILEHVTLANWTDPNQQALQPNPTSLDINPVYQVTYCAIALSCLHGLRRCWAGNVD